MKKLLAAALIFMMTLAGCGNDDYDTVLTIKNDSNYNFSYIEYGTVNFGNINSGKYLAKDVSAGTENVFFYLQGVRCRTNDVLTCDEGKGNELTISNSTIIINTTNGTTDTLKNIADTLPIINIGDTGPGGGMVFSIQGGEYKECSRELGPNNGSAAIAVAKSYKGGGFKDWHLPDSAELNLMYKNLKLKGLGGFSNSFYWSSSSEGGNSAWGQDFRNGHQFSYYKDHNTGLVRAVRAF